MDDKQMEVVRQNIQRGEDRQRERRFHLRRDFHLYSEMLDSIAIATKLAQAGAVLCAIWVFRATTLFEDGYFGTIRAVACWMISGVCIGIVYCVAPYASGITAYFLFRENEASARRATIALTLLAEASTFGWLVWLTSQ